MSWVNFNMSKWKAYCNFLLHGSASRWKKILYNLLYTLWKQQNDFWLIQMNSASHIYYKIPNAEMVTWSRPTETRNKKSETVMETWWIERFSKSTVYTMGIKVCTQQMSWGNIKHFFSYFKIKLYSHSKMSIFFLFFTKWPWELSVSGSLKWP